MSGARTFTKKIMGLFLASGLFLSMALVANAADCQSLYAQMLQGNSQARALYNALCTGSLRVSLSSSPVSSTTAAGSNNVKLVGFNLQTSGQLNAEVSRITFRVVADRDGIFNNQGYGDEDPKNLLTGKLYIVNPAGNVLGSVLVNSSAVNTIGTPGTPGSYLRVEVPLARPLRLTPNTTSSFILQASSFNSTIPAPRYIGGFIYPGQDIVARNTASNSAVQASDSTGSVVNPVGTQSFLNVTPTVITRINPIPLPPQLNISINPALGNSVVFPGTSNVQLASFVVSCSNENIGFISFSLRINESAVASSNITSVQNLQLRYESGTQEVQVGNTVGTVIDSVPAIILASPTPTCQANSQIVFNVYGDLRNSLGTSTITTSVPAQGVTGRGISSATQVSAPVQETYLQVQTGSMSGALRVVNASNNPVSELFVAGTTENTMAIFYLVANLGEDIRINQIKLRTNDYRFDDAIARLSLYTSQIPGGAETLRGRFFPITDFTNPAYAEFTFSSANRPVVSSNGGLYLIIKADFVSSAQRTLSGKLPQISLASLRAEGVASSQAITPLFVPGGNAVDSSANLPSDAMAGAGAVNFTGCFVNRFLGISPTDPIIDVDADSGVGNCSSGAAGILNIPAGMVIKIGNEQMLVTYSSPGILNVQRAVNGTTAASHSNDAPIYYGRPMADLSNNIIAAYAANETAFTASSTNFTPGQVIKIDGEHMYVKKIVVANTTIPIQGVNAGLIFVDRAVNNTSVANHNTVLGMIEEFPAVQGNRHTIAHTKPSFSAAVDSPTGAVLTVNSNLLLAKMNVAAVQNPTDNRVTSLDLNYIDVRLLKTGVNLNSVTLYPTENDLDPTYAIVGTFLSQNSVRFNLASLPLSKNRVYETGMRTYNIRGNVTAIGNNSSIRLEITNLGSPGQNGLGGTALGNGDYSPDVQWADDSLTTFFWTKQAVTQVFLNAAALTSSVGIGTLDSTQPLISSLRFGGSADNILGLNDTIAVTFSEIIDPASISGTSPPAPGGVGITPQQGTTCDISLSSNGVVSIANIAQTSVISPAQATEYSVACSLDQSNTVLTMTITGVTSGNGALNSAEIFSDVTGLTTTIRDLNNNILRDSAVTATGNI